MPRDDEIGSGEAHTRRRRRRQYAFYAVAGALGAGLGAILSAVERGEGSFFSSDFANLSLEPWVALAMAALVLFALLILPLWSYSKIDELLREQNLVGMTGGCLAVLSGYPVWLMLFAGGFVEAPHAFGVFLLGFFGMAATFAYAKIRT